MASPAKELLSRLEGVRAHTHAVGRWVAKCPAHDDSTPSLSVRELDDGRVLLKCFGGCSAAAVVDAVGLQLKDLFAPDAGRGPVAWHERPSLTRGDLLTLLRHSATVVMLAAEQMARGERLGALDLDALRTAAERLHRCMDAADDGPR